MRERLGCGNKISLTVGKHFREEFGSTVEVVVGDVKIFIQNHYRGMLVSDVAQERVVRVYEDLSAEAPQLFDSPAAFLSQSRPHSEKPNDFLL